MDHRPKARSDGVLFERVDGELVVFDQARQVAHCLSAEAASVWEHCDGRLTQGEIARELALPSARVEQAVRELRVAELVEDGAVFGRDYSRREAAAKFARVGGAAVTAPLIYSVAVPSSAAAVSCAPNSINTGSSDPNCPATREGSTASHNCCKSGRCYKGSAGTICVNTTCSGSGVPCSVNSDCCSNNCGGAKVECQA